MIYHSWRQFLMSLVIFCFKVWMVASQMTACGILTLENIVLGLVGDISFNILMMIKREFWGFLMDFESSIKAKEMYMWSAHMVKSMIFLNVLFIPNLKTTILRMGNRDGKGCKITLKYDSSQFIIRIEDFPYNSQDKHKYVSDEVEHFQARPTCREKLRGSVDIKYEDVPS